MKELTAEQIQEQYDLHIKIINKYLTGDRKDQVLKMIESYGDTYVLSPASGKTWYHGAYPGGYLVHVNNVVRFAIMEMNLYKKAGGKVDFTEEELVFAALFHDLGKVGDGEKPNYLPQENEWFRKNRQEVYVNNPELDFMLIPDRSLFILQKYGIKVNQKEWLAIKLHDGLFEESNKAYYVSFNPDSKLKSNMVSILHAADYLASRQEFDAEQEN